MHWMGTNGHTTGFVNPGVSGLVKCHSNEMWRGGSVTDICGKDITECQTKSEVGSWMSVDFQSVLVCPTHLTLRQSNSRFGDYFVRYFVLEGSNDGKTWHVLMRCIDDQSMKEGGQEHTWQIDAAEDAAKYRVFRVRLTGPSSSDSHQLALSGFELHGQVYQWRLAAGQRAQDG